MGYFVLTCTFALFTRKNMETFSGKVVWITGASSGIGEALVHAFAKLGSKVILTARRELELQRVKKEAGLSDENSWILPLDLYHTEDIAKSVEQIKQRFGTIDVLVCNAGVVQRFPVKDSPIEVDRQIMELNFFAVTAITKAVLPVMLAKKSGHIVVISSVMGKLSLPNRSMYAASKHALHGFFNALRAEVFPDNIGVTVVCPGYVRTNISLNALNADGKQYGKMDKGQEHGMPPEKCADGIINAVRKNKDEVFIGGKEIMPILLNRFLPGVFRYIIKRKKFPI
jgi:short-subunit dehydrogenase